MSGGRSWREVLMAIMVLLSGVCCDVYGQSTYRGSGRPAKAQNKPFAIDNGQHFIRLSGAFSYARDIARAQTGPGFEVPASPQDARTWVGAGRNESLTRSNGISPALGIGYRYKYRHLILDLGLNAEYRYTMNGLYDIIDVQANETDESTRLQLVGHYTWRDRSTRMQNAGIGIPVMIGAEWSKFYMMAGAKFNMDVWNSVRENGLYSYRAEFDRFANILVNIPEHGVVENEPYVSGHSQTGFSWDVRACAELGFRLNPDEGYSTSSKKAARYYLGIFGEYAFLAATGHYSPVTAGVRFTVLLPLSTKKQCICEGK